MMVSIRVRTSDRISEPARGMSPKSPKKPLSAALPNGPQKAKVRTISRLQCRVGNNTKIQRYAELLIRPESRLEVPMDDVHILWFGLLGLFVYLAIILAVAASIPVRPRG
jgi:hypothetical protein